MMRTSTHVLVALALLAAPMPAVAGAAGFTLVNATGSAIGSLEIRRHGTAAWKPLGGSAAAGGSAAIQFADPDCAFDLRATLAGGGSAVWSGVNLCEVTSVTLRQAGGRTWVDYD